MQYLDNKLQKICVSFLLDTYFTLIVIFIVLVIGYQQPQQGTFVQTNGSYTPIVNGGLTSSGLGKTFQAYHFSISYLKNFRSEFVHEFDHCNFVNRLIL